MDRKINQKTIIARTCLVDFPSEKISGVPAKVDTGADSSSIWVSHLEMDDNGRLSFILFDEGFLHYSGKIHTTDEYEVTKIRNSTGGAQIRYRVKLSIRISNKLVRGTFSLSDRSKNKYPILIGSRLLAGKFLVDVSQGDPIPRSIREDINQEMKLNPKAFFEKYHADNLRGDID